MYNNVNLHTERAAMTISHALPMSEFVVSLNYVECNGTERTLTQCPHLDATCLNPGAGVSCPMQVQVVLTTELSTTMATTNTSNMTESPENEDLVTPPSNATGLKRASVLVTAVLDLAVLIMMTL